MPANVLMIIINTVVLILLLTFHEWGHAKLSNVLGDPTAAEMGRLSLNPAVHIDPVGTIILPVLMQLGGGGFFGWAKPVPVDPRMLKNPKRDMMLIAAAGPLMNIAAAFVIFTAHALLVGSVGGQVQRLISTAGYLSVILAVFNMIPLHPLDGYNVVYGLLPYQYAKEFEKTSQYGFMLLIGLLFLLPLVGINVFGWVILPIVRAIVSVIYQVIFFVL